MKFKTKGLSVQTFDNKEFFKLYDTIIVTKDLTTGDIMLDSGGWRTKHTKKCINMILSGHNMSVFQKQYEWYVSIGDKIVEFQDNMSVSILDRMVA